MVKPISISSWISGTDESMLIQKVYRLVAASRSASSAIRFSKPGFSWSMNSNSQANKERGEE